MMDLKNKRSIPFLGQFHISLTHGSASAHGYVQHSTTLAGCHSLKDIATPPSNVAALPR